MRIDNTIELVKFINKLHYNNIDIPDNLTLEIDSEIFRKELEKSLSVVKPTTNFTMRGNFMGVKICFKTKLEDEPK